MTQQMQTQVIQALLALLLSLAIIILRSRVRALKRDVRDALNDASATFNAFLKDINGVGSRVNDNQSRIAALEVQIAILMQDRSLKHLPASSDQQVPTSEKSP